jgi:hypothetical protein
MAYELLTGQVPYTGSMLMIQLGHVEKTAEPPHEVVPAIPPEVSEVVMRMLAKKPADRWPTLALAAEALIDGLGATDAQLRREMSMLVQELPADATKSLPATPRTPSLAFSNSMGTQALAASARVEDASTQIVVPVEARDTVPAGAVASAAGATVQTQPLWKRRQVALPVMGLALVGAVLAGVLSSGGNGETPPPQPVGPDSAALATAAAAAAEVAAESARVQGTLIEQRDTAVVGVRVNPVTISLAIGDSARLNAYGVNKLGETVRRPVRWRTSDSIAVTVDQNGWVRVVGKPLGGALVFVDATTAGLTSTAIITVK